MRRIRVIIIAVFLALIGTIIPLAIASYFSWHQAIKSEKKLLQEVANRTIVQAVKTLYRAQNALTLLNNSLIKQPCSPEHIAMMQKIALENRSVEEVRYYHDGLMQCSSWGLALNKIPLFTADYLMKNGIKVKFKAQSAIGSYDRLIALQDKNYDILVDQIWLEITERDLINLEAAQKTISRARDLGYVTVIDDFGTGYSSLSYLQNFALDVLKIDKSFVSAVGTPSVLSNVTYHIIQIARTLRLQIVAEGVENENQRDYLLENKVDFGQGWLFAKALRAKEFIAFLADN